VQGRQAGSRQAGRHFSQTSSHLHKSKNPEAVAEAKAVLQSFSTPRKNKLQTKSKEIE